MLPNTCRFCEHPNIEGAKFCGECGGCLHLLPCPNCGAVTDVTASTCYQCQTSLPWASTPAAEIPAPEKPPPAAVVANAASPWRAWAIAGVAILVAVALLGYYGYRQRSIIDTGQAPAAGGESRSRGTIDTGATGFAPAPTVVLPAGPTPSALKEPPPAERQPATALRESSIVAAPVTGRPGAQQGRPSEQGASSGGCTAAVEALGLCSPATFIAPTTPPVTHTQRSK